MKLLDKSIDLETDSYFRNETLENNKINQAVESYLINAKQEFLIFQNEQSKFNNQINFTMEKPFENKIENENKEFGKKELQYNKLNEKSELNDKPKKKKKTSALSF